MEVGLIVVVVLFSLGFLLEKATDFIKQLKSRSEKLNNGFEAKLSLVPIHNKKSEECTTNTDFTNDTDE